jgi:hypothetical protein
VDKPREAVEQADGLVANLVKRIAEQFAAEREQLEKRWDRGDDVSTEDLSQALKRYRSFFDRLLRSSGKNNDVLEKASLSSGAFSYSGLLPQSNSNSLSC